MWRQGQGKKLAEAARLLARGELTSTDHDAPPEDSDDQAASALAAFGLVAVDPRGRELGHGRPIFHLWPEHQAAFDLFLLCSTQWRHGAMGATGLDYAGIEALIRLRRLARPRHVPRLFAELQVLERATLAEWSRQRRRAAGA